MHSDAYFCLCLLQSQVQRIGKSKAEACCGNNVLPRSALYIEKDLMCLVDDGRLNFQLKVVEPPADRSSQYLFLGALSHFNCQQIQFSANVVIVTNLHILYVQIGSIQPGGAPGLNMVNDRRVGV